MTDLLNTLYLFNTILNVFSTTGTLLFLLYRFTSFFSYIVGFIKFCGRLFNGVVYVKNKIVNYYYPYDYSSIQCSEEDLEEGHYNDDGVIYNTVENNTKRSFFSRCKSGIYNFFFPKKKEYSTLPIYHTRASYIVSDEEREDNTTIEQRIIHDQISNLLDQENEISDSIPLLWLGDRITDENSHGLQMNLTDDPDVPSFSTLLQLHNNNHNMTSININTSSQDNYSNYNPVNTTTENYNYNYDTVSDNSSSTYTAFTDAPTHTHMYYRPTSRASNNGSSNPGHLNESVQSLDLINQFKGLTLENGNSH